MDPQTDLSATLTLTNQIHDSTDHNLVSDGSGLLHHKVKPGGSVYVPLFGLKYAQQFIYSSGFDSSHRVRLSFDDPRACLPKGVNIFSSDPCLDGYAYRRCLSALLTSELSCSPSLLLDLLEEKVTNDGSESSEEDISDVAFIRRHVVMEALERIHEHSDPRALSSKMHTSVSCLPTYIDDGWLDASIFSAIEDALTLNSDELSQDRAAPYYEQSASASAFLLSGRFARLLSPQLETRFCHFDFVLPDPSARKVMITVYPEPEYFARYASDIYVIADDISEHKGFGVASRTQHEEHARDGGEQHYSKKPRHYNQEMEACETVRNYASHRVLASVMFPYVHSAYEHWLDVIEKLFLGPWSGSANFKRLCPQFVEYKVFHSLAHEKSDVPEDVYLTQSLAYGIQEIVHEVFNNLGGSVAALPELPANELFDQINEVVSKSRGMCDILSAADIFMASEARELESSIVESFNTDASRVVSFNKPIDGPSYSLKNASPTFPDLESASSPDQVTCSVKDDSNPQILQAPATLRILEAVAQKCINEFSTLLYHPPLNMGPGLKLSGFTDHFPQAIKALIELKGESHPLYMLGTPEERLRYLVPLVLDRLYTYQRFTTATSFYDSLLEQMPLCAQQSISQVSDYAYPGTSSAQAYHRSICQIVLRFNNILLRISQAQHNRLLLDGMDAGSVSFVASCFWPSSSTHGSASPVSLTIRPLCPCYFCNMVAMDETDFCVDRAYATCKACLCKPRGCLLNHKQSMTCSPIARRPSKCIQAQRCPSATETCEHRFWATRH